MEQEKETAAENKQDGSSSGNAPANVVGVAGLILCFVGPLLFFYEKYAAYPSWLKAERVRETFQGYLLFAPASRTVIIIGFLFSLAGLYLVWSCMANKTPIIPGLMIFSLPIGYLYTRYAYSVWHTAGSFNEFLLFQPGNKVIIHITGIYAAAGVFMILLWIAGLKNGTGKAEKKE